MRKNHSVAASKSLVTGAAGFIGSHLVDELIELGHDVIALDDLSGGYQKNINPKAKFIKGSVTDPQLISDLFKKYQPQYVYHLAAYAAEGLSHFIRNFNYTNNLIGTTNLINAAINHHASHFVFTSSIAVYGSGTPPFTEKTLPQPEDPYGIAKLAAEQDIASAEKVFGLPYTIFRPHNVYGERQNIADRYRNVIGIFINQMLQQKPLTVFGDGHQSRGFTYIKDITKILAQAPFVSPAKNQIFNLGTEQAVTINQLIEKLSLIMNLQPSIRYLPARPEAVHAFANHQKVRRAFGLNQKTTSLDDGLTAMWSWVQKHGAQKTPRFDQIEIKSNLPAVWLEE